MTNETSKLDITEPKINPYSLIYDTFMTEFNSKPECYCPLDYMKQQKYFIQTKCLDEY